MGLSLLVFYMTVRQALAMDDRMTSATIAYLALTACHQ